MPEAQDLMQRFLKICTEMHVNGRLIITQQPPLMVQSIQMWDKGQLDDPELMRITRNFAIFNERYQLDGFDESNSDRETA